MAAFDRRRLHDGPRASNTDPAPVFIVGMPRSGTTLAEQILASHGAVHGAGERGALGDSFRTLGGAWETADAPRRIASLGAPALDREAARYLAALHALAPDKARVVDKMPGNFRLLGFAALLLPGARVISCERDPRDIGASIFRYRFLGYHPYAHDLADLGWYIARQRELMAYWRDVLPIPMITVRLTDWIDDFDGTLRRVLGFLDLPYDPACERFFENEREVRTVSRWQVRSPINANGIGRWRDYAEPLAPLIAELERAGIVPDYDTLTYGRQSAGTAE
ncbi:MAG: sulfotransferase [Acetobacteraceae bacterium]